MTHKRVIHKKLGELLLEQGLLSEQGLARALAEQERKAEPLGRILVSLGLASSEAIARALAAQYGIPYLPLRHCALRAEHAALLAEAVARRCQAVPVDASEDSVTVVMANPMDQDHLQELARDTGQQIQAFLGSVTEIEEALDQLYQRRSTPAPKPVEGLARLAPFGGEERRRFKRVDVPLEFHFADQQRWVGEHTKNISASGLYFQTRRFVPIGSYLVIQLLLPRHRDSMLCVVRVVRTELVDERTGVYGVGVMFVSANAAETEARLISFLSERVEA